MKTKTIAIALFLSILYIIPLSSITYKYVKQAKAEHHHLIKAEKKKAAA